VAPEIFWIKAFAGVVVVYYLETGSVSSKSVHWNQLCRIVRDLADSSLAHGSRQQTPELANFKAMMGYLPEEEVAALALYIISYGELTLLEELWKGRGPFQLNLKHDPQKNIHTLNGREFVLLSDAPNLFECLETVEDYQKLFGLISDMEFRGLIDMTPEGSNLFAMGKSEVVRRTCRRGARFSGDLPKLDAGVVSQGELLQALTIGSKRPGLRKAYDRLLCWATPEMVRQHPGLLKPYAAKHEFSTNGVFYPPKMSISEWSERFEADAQAGVTGTLPSQIWLRNESDEESVVAGILLKYMATNEVQYGFEAEPGYVLCHTSADFLCEFPAARDVDDVNLRSACVFVNRYLPFDLLWLDANPGGQLNDDEFYQGHTYSQFLWLLGSEPEVAAATKNLLTPAQFKTLASGQTIDGALLAVLNRTFGFDNQGMKVKLAIYDVETLTAIDFKFAEGTKILSGKSFPSAFRGISSAVDLDDISKGTDPEPTWSGKRTELVKAYSGLTAMGLWPCSQIPEPASVKAALLECTRKKLGNRYNEVALSLRGYLINAGAEACAAVAKTPAQWEYLVDALGTEAMRPYAEKMTLKALGTVFASELGI
jgi:hypothetical protein